MLRSFPFTADTYLSLFETYNGTIWPAQVLAYGLGIVALFLALSCPSFGYGTASPTT